MVQFIVKILSVVAFLFILSACSKDEHCTGYIEGEYLYIAPALSGRLQELSVKRGDWVKLEAPLFQLEHEFEIDEVEQALHNLLSAQSTLEDLIKGKRPEEITMLKAARDQSEASLHLAKIQLERNQNLIKEGGVSQDQLDISETTFKNNTQALVSSEANLELGYKGARVDQIEAARENVKSQEALLKQAQWKLDQKTRFSPVEGYVQDTFFNPGEWVNVAVPVVSLLPPEKVKARFFVSESKLGKISLNQKIKIKCDSCNNNIVAKINYISTQAQFTPPVIFSQNSRDKLVYLIEAEIPRNDAMLLHPGQPIDVYF